MDSVLVKIVVGVVVLGMAYQWYLKRADAKAEANKIPILVKNLTSSFPDYASEFNADSARAVYIADDSREADIKQAPATTGDWPTARYFEEIFSPELIEYIRSDKWARNTLLADIINARHEANGAPLRFVLDDDNDLRFNFSLENKNGKLPLPR